MKETGVVCCPQLPEQRGQDASPEPLERGSAQREKILCLSCSRFLHPNSAFLCSYCEKLYRRP